MDATAVGAAVSAEVVGPMKLGRVGQLVGLLYDAVEFVVDGPDADGPLLKSRIIII